MTYVTYSTDEEALANGEILVQQNAETGVCRLCVAKNPEGKAGDIFVYFPEAYASVEAALDGWVEKTRARRLARGEA